MISHRLQSQSDMVLWSRSLFLSVLSKLYYKVSNGIKQNLYGLQQSLQIKSISLFGRLCHSANTPSLPSLLPFNSSAARPPERVCPLSTFSTYQLWEALLYMLHLMSNYFMLLNNLKEKPCSPISTPLIPAVLSVKMSNMFQVLTFSPFKNVRSDLL